MKRLLVLLVCSVTLLAGCKKSDSTSDYYVNVNVSGMVGNGLVLQMSNTYLLTVYANGVATFATPLTNGTAYWVTIEKQPSLPAQTCTLGNASGTISGANVSNITLTCAPVEFAYQTSSNGASILPLLINPATGVVATNGSPVPTGNLPQAFTIDSTGRYAFAANYQDSSISYYLANKTNGILTSGGVENQEPGTGPVALAIDPNSKFVYAANFENGGSISGYTIAPANGALTCIGSTGGVCPSSPTATTGSNPSSLASVSIAGGEFLYVTNAGSNNIYEYGISGASTQFGALNQIGSISTGNKPTSISVSPKMAGTTSGPFVYVLNSSDYTVSGYTINPNGTLVSTGAAISTGGSNPNPIPNATTNPSLTPCGTSQTCAGLFALPNSIAFTPNGLYAYVVNPTSNSIAAFSIATTGQLSSLGVVPVPGISGTAMPVSVSVEPTGAFVYTANYKDNSITVFPIGPNGSLGTPTVQAFGNNPISIVTVAN